MKRLYITDVDIDTFDDDLFDIYYKYPLDSLSCRNTFILTDGTEEFEEDYYQTSCKDSLYFDIPSIYFSDDDSLKSNLNQILILVLQI